MADLTKNSVFNSVVTTIKEASKKVYVGKNPVTGQPIYHNIPIDSTEPGFNNKVSIIEDLKRYLPEKEQLLILRGLEGGPGIKLEVKDADDFSGTLGGKIVVSYTGDGGLSQATITNIGNGEGLFAEQVGADFRFKSIVAEGNLFIESKADTLVLTTNGEANTLKSIGSGKSIVGPKDGSELQVKSISGSNGITILEENDKLTIVGPGIIESTTASNIGVGTGIFKNKINSTLYLKSITNSTPNVTITEQNDTILIGVTGTGERNEGINLGTALPIYAGMSGNNLSFKTLRAGKNVTMVPSNNEVSISVENVGEVNSGINLGALDPNKYNVFESKVGTDLRFRRLAPAGNVSITQDATTIYISSEGENNAAVNIGNTGAGLYARKNTNSELEFRRLVSGQNISITERANDVLISAIAQTSGGINLGTIGATVFAGMVDTDLSFKRIVGDASSGVSVTETANDIKISVTGVGEANTASNVGTLGHGLAAGKSGTVLLFKNIAPRSNKVSVTTDSNNNVLVDVLPENIQLNSLGGNLSVSKIEPGTVNGYVLTMVGGVPTWREPHDIVAPVTSVAGRTGDIILTVSDINGLGLLARKNSADWNSATDIINKPTLFSGNYNDLYNKPILFDGTWDSLNGKPTLFSGNYNDLYNKPALAKKIDDLDDVDTFGVAVGNILQYNGTKWISVPFNPSGGSVQSVTSSDTAIEVTNTQGPNVVLQFKSSNVDITTLKNVGTLASKNSVDWNSSGDILNKPTIIRTISTLEDVDTTGIKDKSILKYSADDGKWVIGIDGGGGGGNIDEIKSLSNAIAVIEGTGPTVSLQFNQSSLNLVDFNGNLPTSRIDGLGTLAIKNNVDWDSSDIINKPIVASKISELSDVDTTGLTNDEILVYNGTKWVVSKKTLVQTSDQMINVTQNGNTFTLSFDPSKLSLSNIGGVGQLASKDSVDWDSSTDILNKPTIITTLGSLEDVNTNGFVNGSVLTYNTTQNKWVAGSPHQLSIASDSEVISVKTENDVATFSFHPDKEDLSNFRGNLPNDRITGLGTASTKNIEDFAAKDHSHSGLVPDETGLVDINGVKFGKGSVDVAPNATSELFTLPVGTEMAVVDYYILEGSKLMAGTIIYSAIGTNGYPYAYTDTGTNYDGDVELVFEPSTRGISMKGGSQAATVKYSMRAF